MFIHGVGGGGEFVPSFSPPPEDKGGCRSTLTTGYDIAHEGDGGGGFYTPTAGAATATVSIGVWIWRYGRH